MTRLKNLLTRGGALTILALLLGAGYDWASPRLYAPTRVAGFHMGLLHGALMPAALPTLLMGKDLPIYAAKSIGRGYNIGFILGVNTCGTIFFGAAFWQPRKRKAG